MAIPKIKKQDIIGAIKYIDENGVPFHNQSTKYELISDDGKRYPPKYVIAVAAHIANGSEISTEYFHGDEARRFLAGQGFTIETKEQEKDEKAQDSTGAAGSGAAGKNKQSKDHEKFSAMLIESKNIIFHGAPGTGKSYLAKEIAAYIISGGKTHNYTELTDEQKSQMEFVQFHPSYDYSDFVEGIRPKTSDNGTTIGFELKDGIFKEFVDRARENYEDSQKSAKTIQQEVLAQDAIDSFFADVENGQVKYKTINHTEFNIISYDDKQIIIKNVVPNEIKLKLDDIRRMLRSPKKFDAVKDAAEFLNRKSSQVNSYIFTLYKEILKRKNKTSGSAAKVKELKKYIFIIDEINRGEISKIFGELFFAIDPGYRGKAGEISTQYANMHDDPDDKFYVPENVYIIGTMNDIDRSVDSFDFAMRRRFRFVELKADERLEMLSDLNDEGLKADAVKRMRNLNKEIAATDDLNESYQIGASYFLKLKDIDFDRLWEDYLEPLLQEYVRGMQDEKNLIKKFAKAYGYSDTAEGDEN